MIHASARGPRGQVFVAALLVVLALAAVGCGGSSSSSSDQQANEAYANGVCTAVGGWEQQVKSVITTLAGSPSKATLDSSVSQIEAATTSLETQLKAVPPPNSSDGQAAKQQVDTFSSDATATISTTKAAVAAIPDAASATAVAAALIPLAAQVQGLVTSGKSAVTALQAESGSLGSAFKSTASCKSLGG